MDAEIIEIPFRVDLIGKQGVVQNRCFGEVGKRLMDQMWAEVRKLEIQNAGINHWVYLHQEQLFTGVELVAAPQGLGTLEPLHVELPRYLRHVHRGPYSQLPAVWKMLSDQLDQQGRRQTHPCLEIYGHWCDDPSQLETTILISLAL